jgi:hypothetical protein
MRHGRDGYIDRSGSPRLTQVSFNRDFALIETDSISLIGPSVTALRSAVTREKANSCPIWA